MTLQQLHYAITIAEKGSLNKAAEFLYIAQPSLTSAMQELEKELGITIFHRSGRGVTLTQDGAEFLLYARQVYSQYEELLEKDVYKRQGRSGSILDAAPYSAFHAFAVPPVARKSSHAWYSSLSENGAGHCAFDW